MPRWKWTEELRDIVRVKAETMTDICLAHEIESLTGKQMSLAAVRKMRQRIGVKKVGGRNSYVVGANAPADIEMRISLDSPED